MDELNELFVLYKQYSDSGKIWLMLGLDTSSSDYNDILAIAECLAKDRHEVKVLHAVHYKDPLYRAVYGELIGTRYFRKCPDLIVDGEYVEYESYKTDQPKKAFRNMLHNGLAQSERIIIRKCNLTDGYIINQIHGYIQNNIPVSEVWIFNGEEVKLLYKNTEGQRETVSLESSESVESLGTKVVFFFEMTNQRRIRICSLYMLKKRGTEAGGRGLVHPRTSIGGGAHSQCPAGHGVMGGAEGAKRLSPPSSCLRLAQHTKSDIRPRGQNPSP